MTQPMTPREKVAAAIREHIMVDATGLAPAIASAFIVGVDQAADAILTALASGSGDHAELVSELRGVWLKRSLQNRAADALEAIIAENAALRSERDRAEERIRDLAAMFGVCDGGRYLNDWKARCDRATEAERKLAEADQVIREISETTQITRVHHLARTFLSSTEAERG